ncbi:MAG: hypothetical protein N2578_07200 [Bdellovibrionaceae bacterium]|nr:hypothetical protein [Pseudobdellovibrionaceae bacterium]
MKTQVENSGAVSSRIVEVLQPSVYRSPAYREWDDRPVVDMDEVAQLQATLALLEEIQARYSFLMREVRYLLGS